MKTNCPKCDVELLMRDGYGVCDNCGEIVAFNIDDESQEENLEENIENDEVVAEILEETEEVSAIAEETIEESEITKETEEVTEEAKEEPELPQMLEFEDAPKKSKLPIVIFIVVLLCVGALVVAYFAPFFIPDKSVSAGKEEVTPEVIEEVKAPEVVEEVNEPQVIEETKKDAEPGVQPVEIKTEKTPKHVETPQISYRIRKSAEDSTTQIGAFSDLERAKAFASAYAEDGYKVYDMNGNMIFEP